MSKLRLTLATALLSLSTMAVAAPIGTKEYVKKAGAGDLYEMRSSQIVLRSTQDPRVRRTANMMIADHTKSTRMVKMAARRSGLAPKPPMLDARKRDMIAELQQARGRDRDRVYLDQQRAAHQEALELHRTYAEDGSARPLRRAASQIVPVVQHHIDMLDRGAM